MLAVHGLEITVGARRLMADVEFRVSDGDKVGLVGRNGAGKTTLTKVLAGECIPAAGTVERSGEVGYLPQDPRTGDLELLARNRILAARGLGTVSCRWPRRGADGVGKAAIAEKAINRYSALEEEFLARGGYAAEAEAATIAAEPLACPTASSARSCRPSPAASAAASSWPGSCSRTPTRCSWTSRPTTWTPTPSSGCATS